MTTMTETKPKKVRQRQAYKDRHVFTALGNARRLLVWYADRIQWCRSWKSWVIWDGERWKIDDNLTLDKWCIEIISDMRTHGREIAKKKNSTKDQREYGEAMEAWAAKCENPTAIKSMQDMARHMRPVSPNDFDVDPWVMNCPNGVLDLRSGKLYEHDPFRMLTRMTSNGPSSRVKPERWLKFLSWLWEDPEIVSFVQRAAGLSMSGCIDPQVWFFLHGSGENGKSTFINTLRDVMGDYGCQAQDDVFNERRTDGHPTSIAMLKGTRLVTVTECPSDKAFNTSLLNAITGGDPITARYMRQDPFTFRPECKIWISANDQPTIRTNRHGTWRRIMTIPFTKQVHDRDPNLNLRLREESCGIMYWMLEGCIEYGERGLDPPPQIREATEQYRKTQDYVGSFLTDCCLISDGEPDSSYAASQADVYDKYRRWTEENGCRTMTKISFGKELVLRGFKKERSGDGRHWRGIALTGRWNE